MYPPPHHQVDNIEKMISVIAHFPLGMMVSAKNDSVIITHIPFIYDENSKKLVAHIDKNNPHCELLKENAAVTVVFKGPDTYISPSIYASEDQLPTYNYIMVHVTGKIKRIDKAERAKETMITMTRFLEGKKQKFVLEKNNPKMERFVNYIQAFEIEITNWEGKFKLSQDKNEQDQENAKRVIKQNSAENKAEFIESIYR